MIRSWNLSHACSELGAFLDPGDSKSRSLFPPTPPTQTILSMVVLKNQGGKVHLLLVSGRGGKDWLELIHRGRLFQWVFHVPELLFKVTPSTPLVLDSVTVPSPVWERGGVVAALAKG